MQKYAYEKKVVAFLDILGFKNMIQVEHHVALSFIEKLDKAIEHCIDIISLDIEPDKASIRLFSDCFCISCDTNDFDYFLRSLASLQLDLSLKEIFIRGAVCNGYHFDNDRIIYSAGLINAYELHKSCIYPRIIIENELGDLHYPGNASHFSSSPHIIEAPDNVLFVDYLTEIEEVKCADTYLGYDMLDMHKTACVNQIIQNMDNSKILEKYKWVAQYHNYKLTNLIDPDDFDEDEYKNVLEEMTISNSIFPSFESHVR